MSIVYRKQIAMQITKQDMYRTQKNLVVYHTFTEKLY